MSRSHPVTLTSLLSTLIIKLHIYGQVEVNTYFLNLKRS